ncbi:hypothetical protein E5288_WYG018232 [Bos mutus]|uniref:EF-hand domain-containing protein n=1 Tax=Bos mutus TaxID=72004 RepID=A0A6B0RZU3_9CETA|nr:hypothetical protein [Bos mutus]
MEGAASDPYRRPARRTQWLLSALAHHYGLDRGVENEIVVLATGLDQYLQEVFHHLDSRGAGRLPRADFRALCAVLGLRFEGAAAPGEASGDTAAGDTNSGDRLARLEEENSSLRELVEDLRAALQSSDARCLALQSASFEPRSPTSITRGHPLPRDASSRLSRVRASSHGPGGFALALWAGSGSRARRLPPALPPCPGSLGRVRELEALARQMPGLQRGLRLLEGELRRYRSEGTQLPGPSRASPEPDTKSSEPEDGEARGPEPPPEGAWGSGNSPASRPPGPGLDEQLFRSVEGQAASDEEDDREKWQEAQRLPAEVTALLAGLSGCGSGCDDQTAKKLMTYCSHLGGANHAHALGELETCVAMLVEQLGSRGCGAKTLRTPEEEAELQRKVGENESLRQELQMVETERVRLSLLEEKLEDVLGLLQRLRDLNISKKALGKILLSTLDACRDPAHGNGRLGGVLTCLPEPYEGGGDSNLRHLGPLGTWLLQGQLLVNPAQAQP